MIVSYLLRIGVYCLPPFLYSRRFSLINLSSYSKLVTLASDRRHGTPAPRDSTRYPYSLSSTGSVKHRRRLVFESPLGGSSSEYNRRPYCFTSTKHSTTAGYDRATGCTDEDGFRRRSGTWRRAPGLQLANGHAMAPQARGLTTGCSVDR